MIEDQDEELHISSESIKHLIFREEPEEVVFPMYRSRFSESVRAEANRHKLCHRTMGLPSDFYITFPCEYLKKGSHTIRRPDLQKCVPRHEANVTVVPRHDDWKKQSKRDRVDKNHILSNICKVVNAVPQTGPTRYYDQATNQRYHNCILAAPKFVHSKLFGKVPKYIKDKKKTEQLKLEQTKKELQRRAEEGSKLKEVSQEERTKLLEGLKNRWAEMQKEFQLLPMLNDTPPQIKRKLKLEKDLTALEQEIDHIERNQLIFVYDTPDKQ